MSILNQKQFEQMKSLTIATAHGLTHFELDFPVCSYCRCEEEESHETDCDMIIAREILGDEWLKIEAENALTDKSGEEHEK